MALPLWLPLLGLLYRNWEPDTELVISPRNKYTDRLVLFISARNESARTSPGRGAKETINAA